MVKCQILQECFLQNFNKQKCQNMEHSNSRTFQRLSRTYSIFKNFSRTLRTLDTRQKHASDLWICGSNIPRWCKRSVKWATSHQFLNSELQPCTKQDTCTCYSESQTQQFVIPHHEMCPSYQSKLQHVIYTQTSYWLGGQYL